MAVRKRSAKAEGSGAADDPREDPEVAAFIRGLGHPRKREVEALRRLVLDASPEIREGIKWNAPSFRTSDYFATMNLHHGKGREPVVRLILHTGAKVKETARTGLKVADPSGLLEWLAKDRCMVTISDGKDLEAKRGALRAIIREWIG